MVMLWVFVILVFVMVIVLSGDIDSDGYCYLLVWLSLVMCVVSSCDFCDFGDDWKLCRYRIMCGF